MSEFKTISEVAGQLQLPQHVLRFWETQFSQIKPAKRRGGRRFYNSHDLEVLSKIKTLLYVKGYTIKGAKKALNQHFVPMNSPVADPVAAPEQTKPQAPVQADIFSVLEKAPEASKAASNNGQLKKILADLKTAEQLLLK